MLYELIVQKFTDSQTQVQITECSIRSRAETGSLNTSVHSVESRNCLPVRKPRTVLQLQSDWPHAVAACVKYGVLSGSGQIQLICISTSFKTAIDLSRDSLA